jgi:hypothetical protein
VAKLVAALQPHVKEVIVASIDVYHSVDFKTGSDMSQLEKFSSLLTAFMKIDVRGGYFGQDHMKQAVAMCFQAESMTEELMTLVLPNHKYVDEATELMAYKLRAMLSHCREKFDCQAPKVEPPTAFLTRCSSTCRSSTSPRRSGRRGVNGCSHDLTPFMCYRLNADEEQAQQDQEEKVVTMYFNGKVAIALKADGTTTSADVYHKGSNGFIIAEWLAEKLELQLEVPK